MQWRDILGHARTRLGAAACSMVLLDGEALRYLVAVGPRDGRADALGAPAADALSGEVGAAQRRGEREDAEVRIADELAALGLFHGLGEADIAALAEVCFVRRLARGQVLFLAGEPSEHLCVVRSGLLRVVSSSPHGDQFVLANVAPGQTLGELSILDGKPRSADVVAAEATELIVVPAAAVRALLDREPAALRAFAMELARHLRRLTGAMGDILFLDLPRRLAKLLVAGAVAGRDGTYRVELAGSQSVLAAQLGVTRQSLNKALTGLANRGWIEVAGREVVLRDVAALARFVAS